jgi:class 3 adenylate cyclase
MEAAPTTETDFATAIIASGIADEPVTHLVEGAMRRLVSAGVPLDRMQVGFRILHPLFDGMSITWTEAAGVEVSYYEHIDLDGSAYRLSPFHYMLANEVTELRLRIDRDATIERFPVLLELKERGFTDYLAMIVSFGGAPMTPESHQGLGTSWYSDLRNSTGLADALPVEAFLDLLNVYFDCAAGAVMEEGGQVLDIIGDAILAFFPASEPPASGPGGAQACASALRAASTAQSRLAALKAQGNARAEAISFGIGIHFGDVVFGNAGTAERLKFGIIGRSVNEVARTADMAKVLKREVVVSDAVASRITSAERLALSDLGEHELRGIPLARRLWALASTE